jgi:hypothetical protein
VSVDSVKAEGTLVVFDRVMIAITSTRRQIKQTCRTDGILQRQIADDEHDQEMKLNEAADYYCILTRKKLPRLLLSQKR